MADRYVVRRRARARADLTTVTGLVEDLHRWTTWSPWEGMDPDLVRTYSGPEKGPGATYTWSGNRKAGAGRMEILEQTPERVVIELEFTRPMRSRATTTFHLSARGGSDEGTEVVWEMSGPTTLPVRLMSVVGGMERFVGGDFERGLARLVAVAEEDRG